MYDIRIPGNPWGINSYCAKRLPCDPGSEVAWTTTALQQPILIHGVYSTSCLLYTSDAADE